jgi:hypothetical protein
LLISFRTSARLAAAETRISSAWAVIGINANRKLRSTPALVIRGADFIFILPSL